MRGCRAPRFRPRAWRWSCVFVKVQRTGASLARSGKVSPLPAAFPHFGALLPAALRSAMPQRRTPTDSEGGQVNAPLAGTLARRATRRPCVLGDPVVKVHPLAWVLLGGTVSISRVNPHFKADFPYLFPAFCASFSRVYPQHQTFTAQTRVNPRKFKFFCFFGEMLHKDFQPSAHGSTPPARYTPHPYFSPPFHGVFGVVCGGLFVGLPCGAF